LLAKEISGRAEIVEWKLDKNMMKSKKSCNAHLFSNDIIYFRGKQCRVFSPICMHDFIWQLRNRSVFLSSSMDLGDIYNMIGECSCGGG